MRITITCTAYVEQLFKKLIDVIKKWKCDCIALSGGIDTSVILLSSILANYKPRAYTAIYTHGLPKDLVYVDYLTKFFNLETVYVYIYPHNFNVLENIVVECVGRNKLNSHRDGGCVEIRNDIVFYSVLKKAKEDKCRCIYTGSGGDELFAGYKFLMMLIEEELKKNIERLVKGRFPELEIAKCLNVNAVAPFLDEEIVDIALKIPINCLRSENMQGKEILREILKHKDLHIISERIKTPAESGAGTIALCKSIYDE